MKASKFTLAAKRAFDVACAVSGLVVIWPLLIVIALCVALDSRGGVFFRQTRVGRGGEPFRILKFRTMVPEAERKGMQITVGQDNRVTRVGRVLRRIKLDELPQIFNVIAGDMSLVGPRPEVPKYVEYYTPEQRQVLNVRPGITDPASIEFRNESAMLAESADPEKTYIEDIMPRKLALNLTYIQEISVWGDFLIILRTLKKIGAE